MNNIEIITRNQVELVRNMGSDDYFQGYAAVWFDGSDATIYKPSPLLEETVKRDAFDDILKTNTNVEAWYNHSPDHVLADMRSNTLFLRTDDKGLRFTIVYDDSDPDHQKVRAKLKKGIATGASFQASGQVGYQRNGRGIKRSIEKVRTLKEISIVNHPAYEGTSAIIRGEIDRYNKTEMKIRRSRLL